MPKKKTPVPQATRYETAYMRRYNLADRATKADMDKAKADSTYTNRHVEQFVKNVIGEAEFEE